MSVEIVNQQSLPMDEPRIEEVARRTAEAEGALGELSILLVDAVRMAELNIEWMGGEGPTDVLAFPVDGLVTETPEHPVVIGEVILCPQVADDQAAEEGLGDLAAELDLLVAHGVLHLLGHDHDTEEAAERMRVRERAVTGRAGARAS
ncbi:MAG: rRNA maturation RNase YbeY [Actinomycetota bacterium]